MKKSVKTINIPLKHSFREWMSESVSQWERERERERGGLSAYYWTRKGKQAKIKLKIEPRTID